MCFYHWIVVLSFYHFKTNSLWFKVKIFFLNNYQFGFKLSLWTLVKKRVLCLSVLLVQNIVFLYVFLLNFFNRILWLLNVQKTS